MIGGLAMNQIGDADAKILKMRERLKMMERKVANQRRKNETKVKCYIATGLLEKLNLDDLTKVLDGSKQCEAFCDFIVKQFLSKITVSKNWRDDAVNYMNNYNKQD